MSYHDPVLLTECLDGLRIDPTGSYVDVTFGGGGHSKAILDQLTTGTLFAFDQELSTGRTVNVPRTNGVRTYSSIKCFYKTFRYTTRTVFKSSTNASSLRHSRLATAADSAI